MSFIIAILLAISWVAGADGASPLEAPMGFSSHRPCDGNATFCGEYILAQGTISRETPSKLEVLLKAQPFRPTIYFNSLGGDLQAGLEMGRIIRQLMFDTHIGGPYEHVAEFGQPAKVIVSRGICFSACAYAFLGGVSREINQGGRFGVHQFAGSKRDVGESAAQAATVILAKYLDDMGVDRRLLDLASATTADSIRVIPLDVARALNVDNMNPPKQAWELKPDENGDLYLLVGQRQPRRDGYAMLSFRRRGNLILGTVTYRIRQNFFSFDEMNKAFGGVTQFNFEVNRRNYQTNTISKWERLSTDTFRIRFSVRQTVLLRLAETTIFELVASWPNALKSINPSTEFGTVGLRNGIRAILK